MEKSRLPELPPRLRAARATPPPPPPRRAPANDWLDDADLIPLDEARPVATAAAHARRYEETQRIWRAHVR